MRDPDRIDPVLQTVRELWAMHPDQRLGQLLYNYGFVDTVHPFYVEDEVLVEQLEKAIRDDHEVLVEQLKKAMDDHQEDTAGYP